MSRDFIELIHFSGEELAELLQIASALKQHYKNGERDLCLTGKTLVMLFEKPSSRTRLSFETAINQLGGDAIYVGAQDIGGLGQREPIKDLARVLNGYVQSIVARTFSHDAILELAHYAEIPVINALSDATHPCQAMADVMTIQECCGELHGKRIAYIGDGNNVARSLAVACIRLGMQFAIASPKEYALPDDFLDNLEAEAQFGQLQCYTDPRKAVQGAAIVYTDTWTSMGQEDEKEKRIRAFEGYQVNETLLQAAGAEVKVMHCLPAYRGLEITDEVMESPNSIVFAQAENRLHFQRGLLKALLG